MGEVDAWGHHNSPKDRGSADRYYGRAFNPHYWRINDDKTMARVGQDKMTESQVADYRCGFDTEQDRDEGINY
tara:strand:- start:37 stop:255 length:219 start_codon:yes stop_codon:yes gene_type:complete